MVQSEASQSNVGPAVFFNPLDQLDNLPDNIVADNGIEAVNMIRNWEGKGLDGETIQQLTVIMVITQSPMVATSQDVLAKAKEAAARTSEIFSIASQEQAETFLAKNNVQQLENEGVIPGASLMLHMREFEKGSEIAGMQNYWANLSSEVEVDNDPVFFIY